MNKRFKKTEEMPEYLLSNMNHKNSWEGQQFFIIKLHNIRWHLKINMHIQEKIKERSILTDLDYD